MKSNARLYRVTHVVALLLMVMALSVASAAAVGESHAITVKTTITLDRLPARDLTLAGVSSAPDAPPDVLSVAWGTVQAGWFPVWQLSVRSEAGLITSGSGELKVTQVTPTQGHTYDTTLSYDPRTGVLSLKLYDSTADVTLVSQGWQVEQHQGFVFAAELDAVEPVAVSQWYEPVDLRWDVGMVFEGGFVPLQTVEPADRIQARIRVQGPLPGAFQIALIGSAGQETIVSTAGDWAKGDIFLDIPPNSLPIGPQTVELQYAEDGDVRYATSRKVQVGRVGVNLSPVRYDRESETFELGLLLDSASPIGDVTLDVVTTVTPVIWDASQRKYTDGPSRTSQRSTVGITGLNETAVVPVTVSAPDEHGIWRIDFAITTSPSLDVKFVTPSAYVSTHAPATIEAGESFVVAVLPDTQYYAQTYHDIYMRQTEWLSANAERLNIAFALHVGDITEDNFPAQWRVARNAHSYLDGVIPYVMTIGNHDYAISGLVADRNTTLFNQYFTAVDFPHLAGVMHKGRLENAYHLFEVAGAKYMVINLEFAPSDATLDWANEVVAAYPDHTVIVLTHGYLHPSRQRLSRGASANVFPLGQNKATTMNDGEDIWFKFVREHENILLVLSGHIHADAIPYRISSGRHGNPVYEILTNYQAGENGGNGYLVLLEFTPDQRLRAHAYSPYLDKELAGVDRHGNASRFVIDL